MSWGNNRNDEYGKDSLNLGSWGSTLSDGKDSPEKKQKQSEPKPQSSPGKEPERSRTPREEKPTQPDPDWRKRQGDREEKATQPDPNWRERRAEIPAELSDGSVGGGFADISAFQDAAERIGTLHSMAGKDYRVERTLSKEGGEAAILLCRDAKNERFVAKIYFYAVNDSALKAREQVLRYMSTPEGKKYTLAVCDAGLLEMAGTRYYYEITPFCPDGDLSGRGPMSFDELVSLTGYLNEALHSIHSAGILHRDIKPRNLYWNGERVLIGDFGVARLAKSGATAHTVGTEGYRAPETVLAVTGEDTAYFFDEKGDYYSLGVTLGSLFEGRFVYEGMTSAMIAAAVRNGRLPLRRQDPRREQLENLLNGKVVPLDLMDVNGRMCVDIASVGIDARIGTDVHKYSKIPLIGGATGYITSLVVNVIKGLGQEMKIEAGDVKTEGKFAMVTCCNGNFYGGGFNPIKDANPADGQMNILLTKNISRVKAASLIGAYGDGRYYEVPDLITRVDANKIHVKLDKVSVINIDGEAIYTDDLTVELIPGAVNFIVPEGMTYFDKKPE